MSRRNYNQYAQPYLPPQSGGNIGYQPSYDPAMDEMWSEMLAKKQQRYDVGRQNLSQFQGQVGGMNTYNPDALQGRIGEFTGSVQDMVKTQYGNDFGLAANDITDMIAEEKANPLYKAIDFQNKEVDRLKKAQSQKLGQGERFVIQNDPRDIIGDKFNELLESGDYTRGLEAKYLTAPDYDKSAAALIKDVPANASQYYEALGAEDAELFAQAAGSGNIGGFLNKKGWTGNSSKLQGLKESLTESLYNKNQAAFDAEYPGQGEAAAFDVIDRKINQLSFDKTTQNAQNLGSKSSTGTEGSSNAPIITRTLENTVSDAGFKKYTEDYVDTGINLNEPYIASKTAKADKAEYSRQKEILESNFSNTEQKSRAALAMKRLKQKGVLNEELHAKGLKDIEEFEGSNNFKFTNNDGNELSPTKKKEAIVKIEDARNTYSQNYLTFNNFYQDETAALDAVTKLLSSGDININSVTDRDGGKVDFDGSEDTNDFKARGINHSNGKIIAEYEGEIIEYYPNDQAQETGQDLKEHNDNLKNNGFSIFDNKNGERYLVVEKFNRGETNRTLPYGQYQNVALKIPEEYYEKLRSINDKKTADNYYKAILSGGAKKISNQKILTEFMRNAGDLFEYSPKEEINNR